jgi:hypothetical protein
MQGPLNEGDAGHTDNKVEKALLKTEWVRLHAD